MRAQPRADILIKVKGGLPSGTLRAIIGVYLCGLEARVRRVDAQSPLEVSNPTHVLLSLHLELSPHGRTHSLLGMSEKPVLLLRNLRS